jgi:hypothetical protein
MWRAFENFFDDAIRIHALGFALEVQKNAVPQSAIGHCANVVARDV